VTCGPNNHGLVEPNRARLAVRRTDAGAACWARRTARPHFPLSGVAYYTDMQRRDYPTICTLLLFLGAACTQSKVAASGGTIGSGAITGLGGESGQGGGISIITAMDAGSTFTGPPAGWDAKLGVATMRATASA